MNDQVLTHQNKLNCRVGLSLKVSVIVISIALLSGCGALMRSDFELPALQVPEQWQHTQVN
ncbi:MAG: hypothetical protein ACRCUU_08620, partial [Plesiomonas sp.]